MLSDDELRERAKSRLGTVLKGKYRLDSVLGLGGMAVVYRATHRNRAQFAIKMLHGELSLRQDVRARFLREGYAANSVNHAGVVRVIDDDVAEDGSAFLVMDLLEGVTVERLWEQAHQRLPVPIVAAIVHQLLDVLAAAHRATVIHSDVKPANLFVTTDGTVRVLDFGIARVLEGAIESNRGVPIGTPAFMPPEQALAKSAEIDARTDVWAAGATFFTLVSGSTVHEGPTAAGILAHAAAAPARSLADVAADTPALMVGVIDRALAFDPAMRWPGAEAMRDALAQACEIGFGALPSKVTLASLVGRGGIPSLPVPPAFESAPTLAADHALPQEQRTTAPLSSTRNPPRSRGRRRLASAFAVLLGMTACGAALWAWRDRAKTLPGPAHATVAAGEAHGAPLVFVLPIDNATNDPGFDGTVDMILEEELGRSPVLYPYAGRWLRAFAEEVDPAIESLDVHACRVLAERTQRPATIVRGKISTKGSGYRLSFALTDARTEGSIAALDLDAPSSASVPSLVARLAARMRATLGDPPERPDPPTCVSDSIEADHEYVMALGASKIDHLQEALSHAERAVQVDPGFALAHGLAASILFNLGREADAEGHWRDSSAQMGALSERTRLILVEKHALMTGEFDPAVTALETLAARWPADTRYLGNLAIAYNGAGDTARALEVARRAVKEHPMDLGSWSNLVAYEVGAGEFERAAGDAQDELGRFPRGGAAINEFAGAAAALLGRGADAEQAYARLRAVDPPRAATARADFAMFEGRFADAASLLEAGIAADLDQKAEEQATRKLALLGVLRARTLGAKAAVNAALRAAASSEVSTQYLAGHLLVDAGRDVEAAQVSARLAGHPGTRGRILAGLLEAERLRVHGRTKEAVKAFLGAPPRVAHLACIDLGQAYLDLGAFEDADRELKGCWASRGDVVEALFNNAVTLGAVPPLRYLLARAKDGLHAPDAADAYRAFLAMEPNAQSDPLERDARRRLGSR